MISKCNNSVVTFIVIAKNEECVIDKCLSSIVRMKLNNYQVICVDSGSSDGTLRIMKKYRGIIEDLRILRIEGYSNAAVARNAGIPHARGDIIFFVDGDVELESEFVASARKAFDAGAACVTGRLREYKYDVNYENVIQKVEDRTKIREDGKVFSCGGIFLLKRSALAEVGYFDERLKENEDYDFTLRLSRRHKMVGLRRCMGTHHTIGYDDPTRLRNRIVGLRGRYLGLALRKNVKNIRGVVWLLVRLEHGRFLGSFFPFVCFWLVYGYGFAALALIAAIVLLDAKAALAKQQTVAYRLYLHYLGPVIMLLGFFWAPGRVPGFSVEEIT